MDTLGEVIERHPALPADGLCEVALAAFVRDENCRVLAVVEAGRPIGVVQRESFLARMEVSGAAERPLRAIMDVDPLTAEAGEGVRAFVQNAARTRPAALQGGLVVTSDGDYLGVVDLAGLVDSLTAPQSAPSAVERICAEVREPIAHALAATEGLRRMRLPEGALAHVDTISEAGRAALVLLDVAVELQKAEAGRLEMAAEPRRLQDLMDNLDARWRAHAEEAGVTLLVSYDGQPDCAAMVDDARLLQVFDALIGHAIAYAGRGVVEASLQARPCEDGIALTGRVRDNGAPYAADYLAGMFRGDGDGASAGGVGVRLGLMLAERTMAAMSGWLDAAANTGPGATMSFGFTAPATVEVDARAKAAESHRPGRTAHVLVVDDNATNRMVVEALCEMFDCSTESVADGLEAVEVAKAGRFDLILMDIKMPRMDGVTAAREIRRLAGAAGRVPIIALTANADPDEVREYLAAGMCSVVEKPIKPERLMEALEGALAGDAHQGAAAA